jgi:predicted phage terminase large subunit-like protein
MRVLNEKIIYGFSASMLHSRFDQPAPFPKVHLEWWRLFCSDHPKVAIAAPRGHAKSTAITHTAGLATLLWRERDFALIVSDTEGQAIQFLEDLKRELQENESLISHFGIKRFVRDTQSDVIVEFTDGVQFRILAKGSEQKVRGLKWRNKRPNLIICDDLENDEIVMNDERRDKFRRWFNNALLPCGSKNCLVRVVGTILHMDSMLERLMPPMNAESTKKDALKQWSSEGRVWLGVRYRAHNDDFSRILWPVMWDKERLQTERQRYIEEGFPEGYSQEYLNYPIDEDNAYYRKRDFLPATVDPGEYGQYYIGGDLAISEKDQRAYSVFVVAKLLSTGIMQIVDVVRFRGDGKDIVDEIFRLQRIYSPEWFAIEKENIARSIGAFLNERMMSTGEYVNLVPDLVPTKDKLSRGRSMQARIRAGAVEVDIEADWYPEFQLEMLHFPRGKYKDQVDALHNIGLGLDKMGEVPTMEELEEEQWEEDYMESMYESANVYSITGYGD